MPSAVKEELTVWERFKQKRFSSPPPKLIQRDRLSVEDAADAALDMAMKRMRKASRTHCEVAQQASDSERNLHAVGNADTLVPMDPDDEPTKKTRLPSRG